MTKYDSLVIGGGPAGLTAALYLLRSGMSVALVEKLAPGGQTLLTEEIENYPGFPKGVKGYELADLFAAHLDEYEPARYNDAVKAIEPSPGANRVQIGDEWIEAKTIVICSGAEHRKMGLEREKELTGRGVSYCALCDGNFFRGQVVGVVGGGNTALEESLYLTRLVEKVYLIHRRDAFRGDKHYQDKVLANPKIEVVWNSVITKLNGDPDLTGVSLQNCKSGEDSELELSGLFVFIGYQATADYLPEGMDTDANGFIVTDVEMRTSLPGIFAAGDARSKLCRQVASAVGDGATAANAAFLYLEQLS